MLDTSQSSVGSGFKLSTAGGPKFLIIIIIVIIAAAAGGYWYWSKSKQTQKEAPTLGSKLYQKTRNPAENLPAVNLLENKPEVNPLSETNPFSNIKTNPFK